MNQYGKFAAVYDRLGADKFSTEMVGYTLRLMKRLGHRPTRVLDLCCGTGTAAGLFVDEGFEVAGLDGSRDMLTEARRKLRGKGIKLYCQQLPHFAIYADRQKKRRRKFDLVTCFYDALNYLLTEKELQAAFRAVERQLSPGGYFVFDMNTPEGLKTIWGDATWGNARDDLAWIWRNNFAPASNRAECRTTFFVKSSRHWQRFDEIHVEQGYSHAAIKRCLRRAGFHVRGYYRCLSFAKPTGRTVRICAIARLPLRPA